MTGPFTLPVLGGSLLAAIAVGIHLGETSIGLIKPIYFQGPALHPRDRGAAIDDSSLTPVRAGYTTLYGWAEGNAARAADCGGCEALAARDAHAYSAVVPYFGGGAERPRAREAMAEIDVAPLPEPETEAPKRDLSLYAHYPVSREEEAAFEAAKNEDPDQGEASYQDRDVWLDPRSDARER